MTAGRLRISLVNTLYAPFDDGGAARSVRELAEDLVNAGHEVQVQTLAPTGFRPARETLDGVQVERMCTDASFGPFDRRGDNITRLGKVAWHVREVHRSTALQHLHQAFARFQPDVVHSNNLAGFGVAVWQAARGVPLVHTMRDYYLVCSRSQYFRRDAVCSGQCWPCVMLKAPVAGARRRPDVFVGVSRDILTRHRRLGLVQTGDTTTVVYNWPIVRGAAQPEPAASGDGVVRFGVLGNVHETKGTWTAAAAFCGLPEDLRERSRLFIAGPASTAAKARLARLAEQVPQLTYVGQRVDPRQFFDSVDVSLVPSQWHEPFGRVAAEARILGVPVLASRVGGIPEALEQFSGGVLVDDFRRPEAWTDALARAIVDPPARSFAELPRRDPVWEQYASIYARAVTASTGGVPIADGRC